MFKKNAKFQECANVFNDESSTKDQVRAAGEKALIALYNGEENASLDELRYNVFCAKLVLAKFQIKPETLQPTSAAAKYHSMRVYWQVMIWKGRSIDPNMWGWKITDVLMHPCLMDLPCAPEEMLKLICCKCKTGCANMRGTCKKNGLSCTTACGECRGISCENAMHLDDWTLSDEEWLTR